MLRKNRAFTALALATLGIGIGANTLIFSVVHAVLLSPLPYREPERLVRIQGVKPKWVNYMSGPDVADMRAQSTAFEDIAMYRRRRAPISPRPASRSTCRALRHRRISFRFLALVRPPAAASLSTTMRPMHRRLWYSVIHCGSAASAGNRRLSGRRWFWEKTAAR